MTTFSIFARGLEVLARGMPARESRAAQLDRWSTYCSVICAKCFGRVEGGPTRILNLGRPTAPYCRKGQKCYANPAFSGIPKTKGGKIIGHLTFAFSGA